MFKRSKKPLCALLCTGLIIFSFNISLSSPTHLPHLSTLLAPNSRTTIATQDDPPVTGYSFQYTSFSGKIYNLTGYNGQKIRFALPNSWTQPGALTASQLRNLIDVTDLTYSLLAEVTAGEPQGVGLLTIAVIPTG